VSANLTALVVGLVVGMLVAVLPGLTLVMGVVLALPFDSPESFAIALFGYTSVVAPGGGAMANAFISLFRGSCCRRSVRTRSTIP